MQSSSKVIKNVFRNMENQSVNTRKLEEGTNNEEHFFIKNARLQANQILKKAQTEAEKALNEAQNKVSEVEKKGYEEGYAQGQKDAWEKAQKEADKIYKSAREILLQAEEIKGNIYSETEGEIVDLAVNIAEKIVCRQLDLKPDTIIDIVKAACEQKANAQKFVVYVDPDYLDVLRNRRQEIISGMDSPISMRIIADANLGSLGCRIETEQGYVDGTLKTMLKQVGLIIKDDLV